MTATQAVRPDHRRIRSENRPKDNNPRFPLKISFHKTAQPTCPAFPLPFLPLLLALGVLRSRLYIHIQPPAPLISFPRRLTLAFSCLKMAVDERQVLFPKYNCR